MSAFDTHYQRKLPSFIDSFVEYCLRRECPEQFAYAGALALLGATINRNLWTMTGKGKVPLNQAHILMAPPGTGKSLAIDRVKDVLKHLPSIGIAPQMMTRQAMLDQLAAGKGYNINPSEPKGSMAPIDLTAYRGFFILNDELVNFFQKYDPTHAGNLCTFLDAKEEDFSESLRQRSDDLVIAQPIVTMLAGVQPDLLQQVFPQGAWEQGVCTRMTFWYDAVDQSDVSNMFTLTVDYTSDAEAKELARELEAIRLLYGYVKPPTDISDWLRDEWQKQEEETRPGLLKLTSFNSRRNFRLIKMACLHGISRENFANDFTLTIDDFRDAAARLIQADLGLERVLKATTGGDDHKSFSELVFQIHNKLRKPKDFIGHAELLQVAARYSGNDIRKAQSFVNHLVACGAVNKVDRIETHPGVFKNLKIPAYTRNFEFDGNLAIEKG